MHRAWHRLRLQGAIGCGGQGSSAPAMATTVLYCIDVFTTYQHCPMDAILALYYYAIVLLVNISCKKETNVTLLCFYYKSYMMSYLLVADISHRTG
jgi:hypothetical protein